VISAPLIEYLKKGIFTLLGLILAVYLFVILMTYTGNDPSWSHISSDMTTINNMGGETGAWLSDLLYSFFGFGAWWILAFVVYESILIWWDNKPTFWLMRLVAYVFLLLSASALFAQFVSLIQQITNPASTELEGVAGGIIGLELQVRLAQLLSQWGSALFLTVFVIITATFAFNIHWLTIYRKVTALSWLGAGVKNKDRDNTLATPENNASENDDENTIKDHTKKEASEYEQLPLELQTAEHAKTVDNSGRFSNALSDFLVNSGLADSVKASMATATQATTSDQTAVSSTAVPSNRKSDYLNTVAMTPSGTMARDMMTSGTTDSTTAPTNTSASSSSTMMPVRKVEPSFAWNDASTVDDLLASEQTSYSAHRVNRADADTLVSNDTDLESTNEAALASTLTPEAELASAQSAVNSQTNTIQPSVDDSSYSDSRRQVTTESSSAELESTTAAVDTLAEAWLAEHADVLEPTTPESHDPVQSDNIAEPLVSKKVTSAPDVTPDDSNTPSQQRTDEPAELSHNVAVPSVSEPPAALASTEATSPAPEDTASVSEVADMTPTNGGRLHRA